MIIHGPTAFSTPYLLGIARIDDSSVLGAAHFGTITRLGGRTISI